MDKIVKGYPNWDIPLNANIDEYNETMGNAELLTEDKTVKGAINEIKTGNDETIGKIRDDTQINTADISNLKTSVAQNTSSLKDLTKDVLNIKTKTTFSVTPPDGVTILESECYKKDDKVTFYLRLKRTDDSAFYINNTMMFGIPSNLVKHPSVVNVAGLVSVVWKGMGTAIVSSTSNSLLVFNNTEEVTQLLITGEVIAS